MSGDTESPAAGAAAFLDSLGEDAETLGRRRVTVEAALQWLLDHRLAAGPRIVETGIYSGAHALYRSTRIFARLVREIGGSVHSVDLDPERVRAAGELLGELAGEVDAAASDSVVWLAGLPGPIQLLHLDSWDYHGSRLNRWRSRRHCLRELKAAYPQLAPEAVVLIDDQNMDRAWWPQADYRPGEQGKGARAVPWLLRRGWRVLAEDYQVTLVRGAAS